MRALRVAPVILALSAGLAGCVDESTEFMGPESQTPAPAAAANPQQDRRSEPIEGRYIVLFQQGVSDPAALASGIAAGQGLAIRRTYSHAVQGFVVDIPAPGREHVLEALSRNPQVSLVEQDKLWYIDTEWFGTSAAVQVLPDAPSGLSATTQSGTDIALSWSDNSGDEVKFEIQRCVGAGCSDFSVAGQVKDGVTAFTDTGLTGGTEYCYRVFAVSGRGRSETYSLPSNVDCATTLGAPPEPPADDRPTGLAATPVSETEIDLTWLDNSVEDGFSIERCQGTGCDAFLEIATTGANATTFGDSGLGADTEYCYRLRGFDKKGKNYTYTEYSSTGCATTLAPPPPPPPPSTDPPTGLTATAVSSSAIDLGWTDNSDETGFEIERCQGSGCSSWAQIVVTAADATSYSDATGLVADTEYCYRVRGVLDPTPTGWSNTSCATTDAPPPPPPPSTDPPTGLTATAVSSSAIDLGWTDNSDETAFEIERCQGSGCSSWAQIVVTAADATSYSDATGLVADTEYCYRVRGVLDPTPTGWSNTSCATTLPEGGGGGSRFVVDSFEDSGGTSLAAHTGETGASWTRHSEGRWDAAFTSSGSEIYGDVRATHYASGTPPGADYRTAGHARFYTPDDVTVDYVFVTGRMDEAAATMYMFGFVYAGVNRWELKKMVGGSETLLAASTDELPSGGDTPLIDLRMNGTLIEGYVDGILVTSATDASISAPGRAGIRMLGGNGEWASLMDYEATTLDLAPPPPPPSTDPPTGMGAIALSNGDIRVLWTDNSDETSFEIERCEGTGCSNFAWHGEVAADVTLFTDTGLNAGTEYCYRVRGLLSPDPTPYSDVLCETSRESTAGNCPDTGNHDDLAQLWGIQAMRANLNPVWLGTQAGGECAIQGLYFGLDSGIDSDHPDLNVIEVIDFVGDGSGGEDGHGHGTHTAGSAAAVDGNGGVVGVAPGAPVHGFKVCGDDGSCELSAIIAGIDEITARKNASPSQPMVANMSLGGEPSPSMDEAIRNSINSGVVYALAAGNGWLGACLIPARSENVSPAMVGDDNIAQDGSSTGDNAPLNGAITTTSHNENFADDNCNYGAPVTVAAPGVNITSTHKDGGYATTSGTSMATPHAAGAALLYLQADPSASPAEVEAAIVSLLQSWTTDDTPNAGGRLDVGDL